VLATAKKDCEVQDLSVDLFAYSTSGDPRLVGSVSVLKQTSVTSANSFQKIVSVGIPILCQDGATVYRGASVVVPPLGGDWMAAAPRGWVDLRTSNCALWVERARRIVAQAADRQAHGPGSGSDEDWWAVDPAEPIAPWRMATWIFRHEDKGERIKR